MHKISSLLITLLCLSAAHGRAKEVRDYTLKPEVIAALVNAAQTLKVLKKTAHDIDVSAFVDDRYIREAAKQSGYDYDARRRRAAELTAAVAAELAVAQVIGQN